MNRHVRGLAIFRADPSRAGTVRTMMRELAAQQGSLRSATTTEQRWQELLAREDVMVLLASVDGEVAGYVSAVTKVHLWTGDEITALDDLYVRAPFRNDGIGAALMHALAERSHRPLRWEVQEGNLAGQRFYLRLGARLQRKVIAWWDPEGDTASLLVRQHLRQPSPRR